MKKNQNEAGASSSSETTKKELRSLCQEKLEKYFVKLHGLEKVGK